VDLSNQSTRRAILFDLYGTLIPGGTRRRRDAVSFSMAEILDVEPIEFAESVRTTFDQRVRGAFGNLEQTIEHLARMTGGVPTPDQIALASDLRLAFARDQLGDTRSQRNLAALKQQGAMIGVVTDCSVETPMAWPTSWLHKFVDAVTFSCEVGLRKPDPEMYLSVTRNLNVRPEECLFVGDGGSSELSGARSLGMDTKLLADPKLSDTDRIDEELDWRGGVIHSLAELVSE
jgi:putative hydrolase of the HAD superfamily